MRRHHASSRLQKGKSSLALFGAVVFVVGVALFAQGQTPFMSSEVKFADTSPSGLQIMPASCASPPPPLTGDPNGVGYFVSPGLIDAQVVNPPGATLAYTEYFCISNSSGNNYFLPSKTSTELQAFLNAVGSLPGVSVLNPGPDSP